MKRFLPLGLYVGLLVLLVFVVAGFRASVCDASEIEQPTRAVPQPQCVEIHAQDRGGGGSKGTGAYIGPRLVVTAEHVVTDRRNNESVQVWFPVKEGWQKIDGIVLKAYEPQDVAIIQLQSDPACEPFDLALELEVGQPLATQGYGGKKYTQTWGRLSPKKYGNSPVTWRKILQAGSVSGDSGGPIVDECGRYAGTLWGSVDGETYFTAAAWVVDRVLELGTELDSPNDDEEIMPNPNNPLYSPDGTPLKFAGRYHSLSLWLGS